MGAFWLRTPFADVLGPGTHGTTFGGTPLGCAVALRILEVIQRERLDENARTVGQLLHDQLCGLQARYPGLISSVRGVGLILGFELGREIPAFKGSDKAPSLLMVQRLQEAGLILIPSGTHVLRLLPPLNLTPAEAMEGIQRIETVLAKLA